MKKLFLGLIFLVFLVIAAIYWVLFTKTGNDYIASFIEEKVNSEQDKVKMKVNNFRLTFKTIDFDATIDDNSNIKVIGDLQLLNEKVDLKYDIKIKELAYLENLMKQKLNGPFSTSGTFVGNDKLAVIEGTSDVAESKTSYKINMADFEAKDMDFLIKNAKIDKLLHLLNQPIYTNGNLDLKGNIKDIDIKKLSGKIVGNITKAKLDNKVVNKQFNQKIKTPISYKSDIDVNLLPELANVKVDLFSSLADVFVKNAKVNLKTNKIVSDYNLDIKNLGNLEGFIGKKLVGSLKTSGNIIVNAEDIKIAGSSNVVGSNTTYDTHIVKSKPKYINLKIEDANIEDLLRMLNEPVYAKGKLFVNTKVKNAEIEKLDGNIESKITKGTLIKEVVNTVFKQNLQSNVPFTLNANTKLIPNQAVTNSMINSSLANLSTAKSVFDFKAGTFSSDYLLKIASLQKLKSIIGIKLNGGININGNLKSSEGLLLLDGNSKFLGGMDFNLKNDDFVLNLKNTKMTNITNLLGYKKVFDSDTTLKLNYNLASKKGKLTGNLREGHFLPNEFSTIVNQFSKFDLTREIYDTVDINSFINDKLLTTSLNMKSKNTTINIDKSLLDLEKNTINARLNTQIKKNKFAVKVKGNTSSPKISLDAKDLLKNEAKKQINKNREKIEKKLDKVLKGKLGDDGAKEIIKGIKSLF